MNNQKLDQLRALILDNGLSSLDRQGAAELYVKAALDAVQAPADDDAEVVKAMAPWPRTTELERTLASLATLPEWGANGRSLPEARVLVLKRHRRARLSELANDAAEHQYVREAAKALLTPQVVTRR